MYTPIYLLLLSYKHRATFTFIYKHRASAMTMKKNQFQDFV